MNQKGPGKARPLKIWLVRTYSSVVSSSDVSTVSVSSSGVSVSSSASSEDFRLEGAEIFAITKSLSIVGFAPSGMLTLEIVMTSPTSNPVKSTVILSGISLAVTISSILVILSLFFVQMDYKTFNNSSYIDRLVNGVETLTSSKNKDASILQRKQMWSAAGKAISEKPLFGYGIVERFNSIEQYLPN